MLHRSENRDVIVVGGGPAGASAAIHLAQSGFSVMLLDRATFPRDKACGEFLTPEARRHLETLGVWPEIERADVQIVAATALVAPDGSQVRHVPLSGSPSGYALRRLTLDAILLERARAVGVDVRENVAVRALCRAEEGAVIGVCVQPAGGAQETFGARMVLGADGAHSLVARHLGLVRPLPRLQRVALVTHWRQVAGPRDAIEMRARGQIVCGLGFPDSESANLTLVVPTGAASRIAGRPAEFVEEALETQFPDLTDRLRGAERETTLRTVGCFGHVSRPAVAAGAMLIGDAATFIDPFTGEGVYFALRGAQLAAEVAADALRADDLSARRLLAYDRARRELSRRYLLCDAVQAIVRNPPLFSQVVRRLDRFPDLAERLLRILGDQRPPADILHPGFLWRLLAPEL